MAADLADKEFVAEQYRHAANLNARIRLPLVVTEPAALIDYILSGATKPPPDQERAFTAFVEQEFQRCGNTFHISKESGIFVCGTPRAGWHI